VPAASQFESVTGKGVRGHVDGKQVVLGTAAFLAGLNIDAAALASDADRFRRDGQTVMFLAVDRHLAGLIAVADRIKDSTREAIGLLHQEGVRIVMLPGHKKSADT